MLAKPTPTRGRSYARITSGVAGVVFVLWAVLKQWTVGRQWAVAVGVIAVEAGLIMLTARMTG